MTSAILDKQLLLAVQASIEAGQEIMKIYDSVDFGTELKKDDSPLTQADLESNKVIMSYLINTDIPIISEENKNLDFDQRKDWELCWMVDPLDGTKEFIKRNGEFTVNIALISNCKPILGVIYVPVSKELYLGNVAQNKSYKIVLNDSLSLPNDIFASEYLLETTTNSNQSVVRVVGSRSHMNEETENYIQHLKDDGKEVEIVSKGSSLKFCIVAEGKADIYPRVAPTMEWDTAAGHAICTAMGLKVTNWETGEDLKYNKENLLNPYFLVK
ncbi:3'(2'),5'-bisphosphate nucleotidase CysQ [Flagellimonas zhangzhouensis]|uniref:3'(2'),5'-bisphosphate nucleotidase CysQ n=1 Tax=Flagellimonas zhangzhouensis TaxID=1073328 RepID=A0A1H2UT47_9FLAO|nr:3'(2'),5'-bisphosphate nucleotidase CysQ [Allomuricauda zhangzhouensis]SDQ14434.1 3'(2'),5'-bisphosphate nucleotidase [Allomuricauda zhangzhouensis]SDW58769.1 3'(2'),5'-bisphosphate nucleotidase [Allomuricauda zhangzhouensis]